MTNLSLQVERSAEDGPRSTLLTGGTGFFGRALLRHWADLAGRSWSDFRVVVLTRNPQDFLGRYPGFGHLPWLKLLPGDIERPDTLPWDWSFTHVIHAAADSTLGPRLSPIERYDQIVDGTRNLLEFAARKRVRRFLLMSSGAVYGPRAASASTVSEDCLGMPDPLSPANSYGVGKRAAEHLCALYADLHGIETVIARCFAFAGRDLPLDAHFALGNFVRDALARDEILVGGDGRPLRSYLDQRDLAQWLLVLLERGAPGQAYNVGSDESISVGDLAHLVRDLVSPNKPVRVLGNRNQHLSLDVYVPDITKAREELGLQVGIRLRRAIVDMARSVEEVRR